MSEHQHLSDEDLLDLLMGGGGAAPDTHPASPRGEDAAGADAAVPGFAIPNGVEWCHDCAQRWMSLSAFLAGCRSELRSFDGEGDPALPARILALTTGGARGVTGHTGLSGDLRLVLQFARERLRHSRILRLAAASLLAHLVALPVLAWYAYQAASPPEPRIGFVLPAREPSGWSGSPEPEREVQVPATGDLPEVRPIPIPLDDLPVATPSPDPVNALLDVVAGRARVTSVSPPAPTADILERILWGEVLLNGLLPSGRPGPLAMEARLGWIDLTRSLASAEPIDPDTRACLAALWARADGLAVLPEGAGALLDEARARPGLRASLLTPAPARSDPDQEYWRALVRRANAASAARRSDAR